MANQPVKKARVRKVKNPETFRDKAAKAGTPKVKKNRFRFLSKLSAKVSGTLSKPLNKLAKTKFGRLSRKPLHILAIILLIPYFKGSFKELKLVTWPGWKQSWKLTYAVLAFAIVFGTAIAGLDWVLGKIFKQILIK